MHKRRVRGRLPNVEDLDLTGSADKECNCTDEAANLRSSFLLSRHILYSHSRPDIASFIRRLVEIPGGETSIAVSGGKSLVAAVRNTVASLSDERAVHERPALKESF